MKKFNPIESFPPPYQDWCNCDWACNVLAKKRGISGNPQNLSTKLRNEAKRGVIRYEQPSRGIYILLREDVLKYVESFEEKAAKRNNQNYQIDYARIEEIIRKVIREEFSK